MHEIFIDISWASVGHTPVLCDSHYFHGLLDTEFLEQIGKAKRPMFALYAKHAHHDWLFAISCRCLSLLCEKRLRESCPGLLNLFFKRSYTYP